MKKSLLTLCTVATAFLPAVATVHTVPYATELGADTEWTAYDVNNDGKTWVSSTDGTSVTGTKNSIKYTYHGSNAANDWYIGPAITLEAGKEYKAKFWYKVYSSSNAEKFSLKYANGGAVSDLTDGTELFSIETKETTWTKKAIIFTPSETGDFHFGFYCFSDPNKWNLYLTGFEICENKFMPAPVKDLKVTPGADRALSADLTWTLPTTDSDGVALADDASFDAVTIYRDGVEVALLDGSATSWTDDASHGLTSGYHKYEVAVTVNGSDSAKTAVNSAYIGPLEAFSLPYTVDFAAMDKTAFELFWTPVAGRDDTSNKLWEFAVSSFYGNRFKFSPGSSKKLDNWLISPQMKFTQAGVYKFTIKMEYKVDNTGIEILFGEGTSIGGYHNVIGTITKFSSSPQTFTYYIQVDEPGEYGIAVHNKFDTSTNYDYYISDFRVEKSSVLPVHVTDLTATVNDDATVSLSWTHPSTTNVGNELTSLDKVEVYCNDELVQTLTETNPGETGTHLHTPATAGVHTYHVLPYNEEGAPEGEPLKVTTTWVGDETQALPYTTTFSKDDATTPIWSSFDANGDDRTWRIGTSAKMDLDKSTSYYTNNDYLLAPYMDFQGGYYTITYTIKGGAKNKTFGVGIVSDKKNVASTYTKLGTIKQSATYATEYKQTIHIEEAGRYALALHNNDIVDSANESADEVTKFSVTYLPVLPAVATDLTVTPDPTLALAADISWKNPSTTNVDGVAPELVKAEVLRDGNVIATLTEGLVAGQLSAYTDEELPNAGHYTYSVVIYGPEGASTTKAPEVVSPWIGGGLAAPWVNDGEFDKNEWTIHNVNGDKRSEAAGGGEITWEINSSYINVTSTNTTPDDWAVSPRLSLQVGKTYEIKLQSYTGYGYDPVKWDLHLGTGVHYSEMSSTPLATINTTAQLKKDAQTDLIRIKAVGAQNEAPARVEEEGGEGTTPEAIEVPAGVATLGLHANNKGSISLNHIGITEVANPTSVENIESNTLSVKISGRVALFSRTADSAVLTDASGRIVESVRNASAIDLHNALQGVYMLSVRCGNETQTIKIIR